MVSKSESHERPRKCAIVRLIWSLIHSYRCSDQGGLDRGTDEFKSACFHEQLRKKVEKKVVNATSWPHFRLVGSTGPHCSRSSCEGLRPIFTHDTCCWNVSDTIGNIFKCTTQCFPRTSVTGTLETLDSSQKYLHAEIYSTGKSVLLHTRSY